MSNFRIKLIKQLCVWIKICGVKCSLCPPSMTVTSPLSPMRRRWWWSSGLRCWNRCSCPALRGRERYCDTHCKYQYLLYLLYSSFGVSMLEISAIETPCLFWPLHFPPTGFYDWTTASDSEHHRWITRLHKEEEVSRCAFPRHPVHTWGWGSHRTHYAIVPTIHHAILYHIIIHS